MQVADSLIDLIGGTPMVRLDRVGRDLSCHLLAKLEYLNPGGSVKDRPALAMIEAAEAARALGPGGTIVEPTSGNTGVGLAVVAARRRLPLRVHHARQDRHGEGAAPARLRRRGHRLPDGGGSASTPTPTTRWPGDSPRRSPAPSSPNQYHNPAEPGRPRRRRPARRSGEQTAGRVTHFVAGIGTGGTISGVGRFLKSRNPAVQIVGADPEGSVYSGGSGRPYLVEGIGEDFWPDTYDPSVVDRVIVVSDRDSFLMARRITREEGILAGGSCGTAVWAALELGRELGADDVVVVAGPRLGTGLPLQDLQRRMDGRLRVPAGRRRDRRRR